MMCGSYLGQFLSQQIDTEIQGHPQRPPDINQSLVSGLLTSGAKTFYSAEPGVLIYKNNCTHSIDMATESNGP